MGRITGSASIETLVRVGIEKEHGLSPDSKMVVLHDFAPCVDDELEVSMQSINIITVTVCLVFVFVFVLYTKSFLHKFLRRAGTQSHKASYKKNYTNSKFEMDIEGYKHYHKGGVIFD